MSIMLGNDGRLLFTTVNGGDYQEVGIFCTDRLNQRGQDQLNALLGLNQSRQAADAVVSALFKNFGPLEAPLSPEGEQIVKDAVKAPYFNKDCSRELEAFTNLWNRSGSENRQKIEDLGAAHVRKYEVLPMASADVAEGVSPGSIVAQRREEEKIRETQVQYVRAALATAACSAATFCCLR